MELLTFFVLELLLGTAELLLGPLDILLQCTDLRSQCGRGQQRSLQPILTYFFSNPPYIFFRSSVRLFFPNTELSIRGYWLHFDIFS